MGAKLKILFLCTGNACRSQMAEALCRHYRGDRVEPYSAGIVARGVDPLAVEVLREAGVDCSGQCSKTVDELAGAVFDVVVTVCDHARESCPVLPGAGRHVHHAFEDPPHLAVGLPPAAALAHYRRVRDEIRAFVLTLPEAVLAGDAAARTERDALGEVRVPAGRYYGAQTQRALGNFDIGDERFPAEFLRAHALLKKACAAVNVRLGLLDARLGDAIGHAADEAARGDLDAEFPLVIWQSGSGTQTNMNVNEVLAGRANELLTGARGGKSPVHPNDHVNLGQSTNDTVPASMHIAAYHSAAHGLLPALRSLTAAFDERAAAFGDIVKIGRTHLQDAVPLTLGQEFSGYAAQLRHAAAAVGACLPALAELPVGGTAVGTGLNAPAGFDAAVTEEVARLTGCPFRPAANKFAALAAHDAVVSLSGALRGLAAALLKIANDLRWLASGPRSGLGEIALPANEPGSSIMPGKVNPTQCEMVTMVACQVYGNDAAIALAGSQGQLELNVYKPLLAHAILQSLRLLAGACRSFETRCVAGIEADRERIAELLGGSLMLVTALNPHIGYDKAAQIALTAWRERLSLRAAAMASGHVTAEEFDRWVRPEHMTGSEAPAS